MDTEELIQDAISKAKAGDKAGAKRILSQVIRQEPGNARVWFLLSQVDEDRAHAIYCLEQVLRIQPDNAQAKERLAHLQSDPKAPKKKMSAGAIIALVLAGIFGLCVVCGGGILGLSVLLPSATLTAVSKLAGRSRPIPCFQQRIRASQQTQQRLPQPTRIPPSHRLPMLQLHPVRPATLRPAYRQALESRQASLPKSMTATR